MLATFAETRWRDLVAISVAVVLLLVVIGALGDGPLLSETALIGAPLGIGACALLLAYAKRRVSAS